MDKPATAENLAALTDNQREEFVLLCAIAAYANETGKEPVTQEVLKWMEGKTEFPELPTIPAIVYEAE